MNKFAIVCNCLQIALIGWPRIAKNCKNQIAFLKAPITQTYHHLKALTGRIDKNNENWINARQSEICRG
jgi:hypothetical protein